MFHDSLFNYSHFLGPEFPSIIGGLFGMAIVTIAIRFNFLVPKDVWEFEQSSKWPNHWLGNVSMKLKDNNKKKIGNFISWFPYILLAFILILSRTNDNLNKLLKSVNLSFLNILERKK